MMQLYCPACENVVTLASDAADEVLPCPSCREPIYWLGRRKARPLTESSQIVAAPPRVACPAPVAPLPEPAPEADSVAPQEDENWELECDSEFDLPCAIPITPSERFVALPYRPEGGVLLSRLPLFLVGLFACGIGLGALASTLGQTCYLILLYPLVLGMLLAAATILFCRLAHVRNPLLAGTVAFVAGALAMMTMHYLDYRRVCVDPSLGFLAHMEATARAGMTVTGNGPKGLNLGTVGTYAYWTLEAVIVLLIASLGGAAGARNPYCSNCRRWKEDRFLGTLAEGGAEQLRRLERGYLSELSADRPSTTSGPLVFTASVCPGCGGESPIEVRIERNPRVRASALPMALPMHRTFPGEALPVLERVFKEPSLAA